MGRRWTNPRLGQHMHEQHPGSDAIFEHGVMTEIRLK